tara:strand:+ start:4291 stop:5223 length:933 start_codon:yes stop_codon:yes gene_type:complete
MQAELSWFFVVGAQKSGTTTLYDWLSQSEDVALPWSKETHYFSDSELYLKGNSWYLKQFQFKRNHRVAGEVDPEYMYFPECAERIKKFSVNPKLIFLLRDPLSRAYSNYLMSVRRGYESLSFADALNTEKERLESGGRFSKIHHGYMERSLYAKQIKRMLTYFPSSSIMILLFEELFSSQDSANGALRKVCDFIEVDANKLSIDVAVIENQASEPVSTVLRDFVYKQNFLKKLIGRAIPSRVLKIKIMQLVDKLNMRPISKNMAERFNEQKEIPGFVYGAFIDDLKDLQRLVDIDVAGWITHYEQRQIDG